jgi:L-alanine-DL-glutamate epimerase-like enolase superfamily enzyme
MTAPTGIFRDSHGTVSAPDGPGLGVETNLDTLRKYMRRVRIELDGRLLYESPEP